MARPAKVGDRELLSRLSDVFQDVGYESASLNILAKASGLKKASLYHRFPGGKEQMANEVLGSTQTWLRDNIEIPLRTKEPPAQRLQQVITQLDTLYQSGERTCLLNLLSTPRFSNDQMRAKTTQTFEGLIAAFTYVVIDAGIAPPKAAWRAQRAVMMMQGALVLSRATNSPRPFKDFLARLPVELFS